MSIRLRGRGTGTFLWLTKGSTAPISLPGEVRLRCNLGVAELSQNTSPWAPLADAYAPIRLFGTSINDAPVQLTLDGAIPAPGNRLVVPAGSGWRFFVELSGLVTAGTDVGKLATANIKGAIKNIGGTTAIGGTTIYDALATEAALIGFLLSALEDNANSCLAITCTGVVGVIANSFNWNAIVYLNKVA